MSRRFSLVALALIIAVPLAAAAPPPGFADALVTGVASPTALAFTPDGRLLIATQTGQLRVFQNGALLPAAVLDLRAPNHQPNTRCGQRWQRKPTVSCRAAG